MKIIAEIKTHSPFGWSSNKSWEELFAIANDFGDILSIHTDPRWHGSFELIKKAKQLTTKPILAKGIHAKDKDIEDAISAGADYVLVVGRLPSAYLERCLIEPYTIKELSLLPKEVRAVWNSRDLETGGLKTETFTQARKAFSGWLCQASNIKSADDIKPAADAIFIGTHLESFAKQIKSFDSLK
jgi:indole-3-glycerol phosphate synthase